MPADALFENLTDGDDSSNCPTCHTSQEDLKALAEEPEGTQSLSEGEG